MHCASCQHDNPDGARFCNACGAPLLAPTAPELKRLTVMFCDLVGSVELATRLDPEDWLALLAAYQAAAGDAIRRHQGHVAQHLGDGLVAYFGYPLAGEDDAARAVQAALDVVAAVAALPARGAGNALHVRVGLHTGAAVMGDVGSGGQREYLALGDTPNIAARVQAAAAADTVVASAATHGIVQQRFRCRDLGEHTLKGLSAPMRLHQVLGPLQAERDDAADSARTPLFGRGRELDLLCGRWHAATQAPGVGLLLLGEPGIGKSRLARELRRHADRDGASIWLMRCSAQAANTPFAPLTQLLAQAVGVPPTAAQGARADALAATLAALGIDDVATLAPLASLLGIEWPADAAALSAQAQRERTFAAATAVVRAGAARRPTLLVVEDLHWADPSTLEWLGRLAGGGVDRGLMVLLTARHEPPAPWPPGAGVERLVLEPCTADEARAMVRALDGRQRLDDDAVERIVARADGNPLFVEELTRAALEAGGEAIPATLQEQTLARLDRLGPAKAVLQQAAVIGRHFGRDRLRAVCRVDDDTLARALQRGVEAHLLTPLGSGDVYAFRHALLQDAAYASLLRSARQACHLRVAEAMLADDASVAELHPELLAHHYGEAGQAQAAIGHGLRAAHRALARSACLEAAAHGRRALDLLGDAAGDERALALELELQLVIAPALMAVHGVLDARVEQAYTRARVLCEHIGKAPKLLVPLWGLWAYELMRGRIDDARAISLRLGDLAQKAERPVPSLVAAATMGMTLFYRGDLAAARAEFARGIALYRVPQDATRSVRGVHDPGVMCHAFDMLAGWLTGDADGATTGAARLRDMAPALAPYDAAFLWCADALLAVLRGDAAVARESASRGIAIAREQAFNAWLMMGSVLQGWGRAVDGAAPTGLSQMQRAYDAWCATGARNLRPLFLALLADAWLAAGDPRQALQAAEAGLAEAAAGERCWMPELQRLQGVALAGVGERAGALDRLRAAVAAAEAIGAAAWRERAHASLADVAGPTGATA